MREQHTRGVIEQSPKSCSTHPLTRPADCLLSKVQALVQMLWSPGHDEEEPRSGQRLGSLSRR